MEGGVEKRMEHLDRRDWRGVQRRGTELRCMYQEV